MSRLILLALCVLALSLFLNQSPLASVQVSAEMNVWSAPPSAPNNYSQCECVDGCEGGQLQNKTFYTLCTNSSVGCSADPSPTCVAACILVCKSMSGGNTSQCNLSSDPRCHCINPQDECQATPPNATFWLPETKLVSPLKGLWQRRAKQANPV